MSVPSGEIEPSKAHEKIDPNVGESPCIEEGHQTKLEELEVDIAVVLEEGGIFEVESDQSPLPEGEIRVLEQYTVESMLTYRRHSSCGGSKC